jgi:hypothetical protein
VEMREMVVGGVRALARLYEVEGEKMARSTTVEDFFGG